MGDKLTFEKAEFRIEREEGYVLRGDVRTQVDGQAKPVLIIGHGFRGHKDWGFWPDVAERFARHGFYTVTYNFSRIEAASSGDEARAAQASTLSHELADWFAVVETAARRELPLSESEANPATIAVLGHSRAGGSSLLLAGEYHELKAVVVWNGGGRPLRPEPAGGQPITLREQAIIEDLDRHGSRFDVQRVFAGLKIPVLVVQGDQDHERLLEQNRELQRIAPSQTFVSIPGGNHTFGAVDPYTGSTPELDAAFEATADFLDRVFGSE